MAMVSGVLRVLLLSSSCLWLLACNTPGGPPTTEMIVANSGRLHQSPGILLYDNTPFNGSVFYLYDNGDTAEITPYINGREHGQKKSWWPGNKLKEIRPYLNGLKHGIHKGWWPNGKPAFEYQIANGQYEGNVKEWNQKGILVKDFNYIKGQEQGRQRMWYADGSIQANYEVRNGRKYGLTGTKSCTNVWNKIEE